MTNRIEKITSSFNSRNPRERFVITILLAIFLFLIWFFLFFSPLGRTINSTSAKLTIAKKSADAISALYDNYQLILRSPSTATEQKIRTLESKLLELQNNPLMVKKIVGSPDELKDFLQAISKTGPLISLLKVQSLSSTPVTTSKVIPLSNKKIQIEFIGSYFNVVAYLQYLENLPWYLSFDALNYQVEEYPNAKVTLIMSVLSTDAGAAPHA